MTFMYLSYFRLPDLWNAAGFMEMDADRHNGRFWRNSENICALADSERHFGHVIRTEQWDAYDATQPGEGSRGFMHLGSFADRAEAMQAVESAVMRRCDSQVMHAGARFAG